MIDVIIPAYNTNKTMTRTLNSIVNQTFAKNIKVYIIDDASKKPFDDIVKKFKDKLDITLYRLEKNMGPGFAREYGILNSNSKYVIFIDSDDEFDDKNAIETMYNVMEEKKYDGLSTIIKEDVFGELYEYYVGFDTLHGKIYRRSFLEEKHIEFPNTYNSEDIAFNFQVISNTTNIGQIDTKSYIYIRRENSLTQTSDYSYEKHIKCYVENMKFVIKRAKEYDYDKIMMGNFMESLFCYFYHYFKSAPENDKSIENIYDLIDDYSEYIKYYNKDAGSYWLNYWTIQRDNCNNFDDYQKFIEYVKDQKTKKER